MSLNTDNRIHLFAGPTLYGLPKHVRSDPNIIGHLPVKRRDIESLVVNNSPGIIVIVDGIFHTHPAVGHSEIMAAMACGWELWGLSSLGAIRAVEMERYGMKGYGKVYAAFRDDGLSDDEVTLIHQVEEPFFPLSEPLIHIRQFVAHAIASGDIAEQDGVALISRMKKMWYADRTLQKLRNLMLQMGMNQEYVDRQIVDFDRFRIKRLDLIEFLKEAPWIWPHDSAESTLEDAVVPQ